MAFDLLGARNAGYTDEDIVGHLAQKKGFDLDGAINSVNTMRSNIGAFINRLEHAVNNLLVSETNQQAAESNIRDVDFAQETSIFTKNQILTQSAIAMLAQSNMIPSTVLSLIAT